VNVRLFAGIPVPESAQAELGRVLEGLQSNGWPVRWVRQGGLHLTLKFFGWVDAGRASQIEEKLSQATEGFDSIPMSCTGLGSFPPGRRARVIWAGLEAPASLELLQDRVERGSESLGFPLEGRPFRPHITLGRVEKDAVLPPQARTVLQSRLSIDFLADRLTLFESRMGRGGSMYTPRHTIELSSCPAV
jgi:RNA 2',3'-cyclic 3'-phosphodiesterase